MVYRFVYYSFGILLGIIVVWVLFGDRIFSCTYFPNQRVLKKINDLAWVFPSQSCLTDTTNLPQRLFKKGKVNFSKSYIQDVSGSRIYWVTLSEIPYKYIFLIELQEDSLAIFKKIMCDTL